MPSEDYESLNRALKIGALIGAAQIAFPEDDVLEIWTNLQEEDFDWEYLSGIAEINTPSDTTKELTIQTLYGIVGAFFIEED